MQVLSLSKILICRDGLNTLHGRIQKRYCWYIKLIFLPFDKTKIRFLHFPLLEIFALKQNLCKLQWVSDKARQKWSTLGLMKSLKDRKRSSIFWISGPNPYRPFVLLWVVRIHWLELPQLYHRGDEGATKEILQLCLPGLKLVVTTMTSGHLKFCQLCKFFQKTTCFLTIYPFRRHDLPLLWELHTYNQKRTTFLILMHITLFYCEWKRIFCV